MAEEVYTSPEEVSLEQGSNDIPAVTMGETGTTGILILGGQVLEECQHELRWPEAMNTYKKMAKDGAIAPALELVEMMISRVPWYVKIPEGYEDQLKDKANFLRQCMSDMEHDWQSFIKQVVSFNRYGFCINEKVYRYRTRENGSKYNDGLVGIKKLPIRSQDSIVGWKYKNKGRELAGLDQEVLITTDRNGTTSGWDFSSSTETATKFIPRKKFLHFRNNPLKDSPVGTSPLNGAWSSWKYKTAFMESEAIGVAQDMNGFKVLYLPPEYMVEDATEDRKASFKAYQTAMANMHQAKQSGLILPLIMDQDGNKLFEFDVISITGQKSFDTNSIISRYNSEILTCLFADFLALGNNGSGSFSLAESKISIIEMTIQSKLDEIKSQLNHDLVKQLFQLNGWDTDVMPEICYGAVAKESLDEVSKYVQRVSATGNFPKTVDTINWVMEQAGIPYRVPQGTSQEDLDKLLSADTSNSGAGMTEGLNNGTGGSSGSSGDSSTSNNENV
jgi:hypothetical protein